MGKVKRIIEWQENKQRTPAEGIKYIQDEIDAGKVTHVIAIVLDSEADTVQYVPCAKNRDYRKSSILWDLEQFKRTWLREG